MMVMMMMMMIMRIYAGLTAEELIAGPGSDSRSTVATSSNILSRRSRSEAFRQIVSQKHRVPSDAVDLFSIINHPAQPDTVDMYYSVRADFDRNLFFKPAKLNGVVLACRNEV